MNDSNGSKSRKALQLDADGDISNGDRAVHVTDVELGGGGAGGSPAEDELGGSCCSPTSPWRTEFLHHWPNWLFILGMFLGVLLMEEVVRPTQQRIHASDPDISYPLMPSSVPNWLLLVLAYLLPIVIFVVWFYWESRSDKKSRFWTRLILALRALFGTGTLVSFITGALKNIVGRPRPNFLALCEWSTALHACQASQSDQNQSRRSFPSGHASSSFGGMTVLTLCFLATLRQHQMQQRYSGKGLGSRFSLLALFVTLSPMGIAAYVGASRVIDYWHRADDVVAGALIGVVVAYLCTDSWSIVSGHPKRPMHRDHDDGGGHRRSSGSIEERRLLSPMVSAELGSGGGDFGVSVVDDGGARVSQ